MVNMLLLLFFVILVFQAPTPISSDCWISVNEDLGNPQPLIVNLNYTIRDPQQRDVISFYARENITLSCPGSHLQVVAGNQKLNLTEHETAICSSAKLFTIHNATTIFSNITCTDYPSEITRLTNKTCENGNQEIEIGFLVQSVFIRHLRICFDNKTYVSLYSHIQITPSIRGRQLGFPRSSWINDDLYSFGTNRSNKDANALLYNSNQIAAISKLIGYNSTTNNPYVNDTADLYLARGHLAAKADFVFGSQQRLTFHMVNSAPQWQTFNGRNWAALEADSRNLASDRNLILQVYTGTYGVMSLPQLATNINVEIYLYNDDKGSRQYPVPLLFWKYLYEPRMQAGIVFVGVNHPYIRNISRAIICEDIYDSINWTTTFIRNDIVGGFIYACSPDEFRKTVTYMPYLSVKNILTFNSTFNNTHNFTYSSSVRISGKCIICLVIIALLVIFQF